MFQRKIMPWETNEKNQVHPKQVFSSLYRAISIAFDCDCILCRENISFKDGLTNGFLDENKPNLGGLARTCEIYQVEKLVVNDLKVVKDSTFLAV